MECSNYFRPRGCELGFGGGVCPQVEVKRLWLGNGDSVPVACRCGLNGRLLRVGEKGNLRTEKIPPPKKEETPLKPFQPRSFIPGI